MSVIVPPYLDHHTLRVHRTYSLVSSGFHLVSPNVVKNDANVNQISPNFAKFLLDCINTIVAIRVRVRTRVRVRVRVRVRLHKCHRGYARYV